MKAEEKNMIDIVKFGAVGDGVTLNTEKIQAAIDAAAETGETVCVPGGVFRTGTLNLHGVSLHLEAGAVLKASEDLNDYPPQDYVHNELGVLHAMLVNLGHDNVTIDGSGTIDLSGKSFYDTSVKNVPESRVPFTQAQIDECTYPIGTRPSQCIFFHNSKNITLRGIRVIDAPCWTLSFNECENVKVIGLTIDTDRNVPNDDGIHFCSCKGVIVSDCNISSGDDCIAISGITNWGKPCEDIVITNCVLRSCSKAIVIGYIYSHIRNVTISNCIIKESNRGLCFMCNDEGALVENVRVSNMIIDTAIRAGNWWGNGEAVCIMGTYHHLANYRDPVPQREAHACIRNVLLQNLNCTTENALAVVGENGSVENVHMDHLTVQLKDSENLCVKGRVIDISPAPNTARLPEEPTWLYLRGVRNVTVTNAFVAPFHGKTPIAYAEDAEGARF